MPTPPPLDPSPVRFDTPLHALTTPVALEDDEGTLAIAEVSRDGSSVKVRVIRAGSEDPQNFAGIAPTTELGDFAVGHLKRDFRRAFALPPGRAMLEHQIGALLARSLGALALVSISVLVVLMAPTPTLKAFVAGALLTLAAAVMFYRPHHRARSIYKTTSGKYGFEHLLDDRPRVELAERLVDDVKEEYGRLLSDIVYRIESPALFDPACEATRRFTEALLTWDSRPVELEGSEVGTLAAAVQVQFATARAHAESVGMDYLPEEAREPATRALNAAKLARSGSTDGERKAALNRAAEILRSLAIYYLPNPREAERMIAGHRILALPGRRVDVNDEEAVADEEAP